MKLKLSTIDILALMICGDAPYSPVFPYRSSSYLTQFFRGIDQNYVHDGSTRKWWVSGVLEELNDKQSSDSDLPPDGIKSAIEYLLDPGHFVKSNALDHSTAIDTANRVLESEGLYLEKDEVRGTVIVANDLYILHVTDFLEYLLHLS
jgi:hypothetical protein